MPELWNTNGKAIIQFLSTLKRIVIKPPNSPKKYRGVKYSNQAEAGIMERAHEHFRLTDGLVAQDHWGLKAQAIRKDIGELRTVSDTILYAQSRCGYDHRATVKYWQSYLTRYEDKLRYEYPQFSSVIEQLCESPYSKSDTLLEYRGRLVSNVFYFHLREMLQCLACVGLPEIICEIGGGYGDLARLWMSSYHRPKHYILVDLPETLFFAEVYLKAHDFECLYLTKPDQISRDDISPYDVILCPVAFRDSLKGLCLDLVINTGSLGELSEEWVSSWMKWLDEQNCKWFYSVNYFGQPLNDLENGENLCSITLSPQWVAKVLVYDPAYFMLQSIRNFAEILAYKENRLMANSEVHSRYTANKEKALDGQTLLEAMDIVRNDTLGFFQWDLLNRCLEMPVIPKEAYALARQLERNDCLSFRNQYGQRRQLSSIRCQLEKTIAYKEWRRS